MSIHAHRRTLELLDGEYASIHHGRSHDFDDLREYQPGDDKRYIHWRSSAKAGKLLVRQFLDTRRSHLTVLVDTDPESYGGSEDLAEVAISVAGSLALRTIADESDPVWSRDGTRIAFSSGRNVPGEEGPAEVYSMASDGSCLTWLTNGNRDSRAPSLGPGDATPASCATDRPPLIEPPPLTETPPPNPPPQEPKPYALP